MSTTTRHMLAAVASRPIRVSLSWDSRNPFEVRMDMHPEGEASVRWLLAYDTLAEGMHLPSGLGDVQVSPGGDGRMIIVLAAPSGRAVLTVDTAEVQAFLAETWVAELSIPDYVADINFERAS